MRCPCIFEQRSDTPNHRASETERVLHRHTSLPPELVHNISEYIFLTLQPMRVQSMI